MKDSKTKKFLMTAKSNWQKGGSLKIVLVLGAVGLLLLSLPEARNKDAPAASASPQGTTVTETDTTEKMEAKLEDSLSRIDGVGRVSVMITLNTSSKSIYLEEHRTTADRAASRDGETGALPSKESFENTYVMMNVARDRLPVLAYQIEPEIRGVVVVCDGGSNKVIQQKVTQVVTTAYHISSNKVIVTK